MMIRFRSFLAALLKDNKGFTTGEWMLLAAVICVAALAVGATLTTAYNGKAGTLSGIINN